MDLNDKFLSMALLAHFEESREALASRHSSRVEDDEDEEEDDDEPREEPDDEKPSPESHRIDTERLRCSCGAPMCFTCGWCSAQCICPEKSRG